MNPFTAAKRSITDERQNRTIRSKRSAEQRQKLPIPFEIGIIKKVLDGKDVRKAKGGKLNYAKGGKMGCYAAGGAIATAKGMGAAIKGGKFHEA
jgi:hypothetical protein